jgi:hypothetical protein
LTEIDQFGLERGLGVRAWRISDIATGRYAHFHDGCAPAD